MNASLIGRWDTAPDDEQAIRKYGKVTLYFKPEGVLEYTIHAENKRQIVLLTYRIEGSTIITDQPSAPKEERTTFSIGTDGKLRLNFSDRTGTYVRSDRPPNQSHIH